MKLAKKVLKKVNKTKKRKWGICGNKKSAYIPLFYLNLVKTIAFNGNLW